MNSTQGLKLTVIGHNTCMCLHKPVEDRGAVLLHQSDNPPLPL